MSSRAAKLSDVAEDQVTRLVAAVSGADPAALASTPSGRDKLGDGSVATLVAHTTDNYRRIGGFVAGDGPPAAHVGPAGGGHGHGHDGPETTDLAARLAAARAALAPLASLSDERLDSVPPEGSFRFADGRRSLEEVLSGLLRHQGHQVEAIESALA
ncbi:MAG: hypothetical protein QM729_18685 [Solirubrobacterales bacterium]